MRLLSLSIVSDCLFAGFTGFLFAMIIFGFFLTAPFTFILSGLAGALTALVGVKVFLKKKGASIKSKEDQRLYDEFIEGLNLMSPKNIDDFFIGAAKTSGLIAVKKRGFIYIADKKCALFTVFNYAEPRKTDVVKAFNALSKGDKAAIISKDFSEELKAFAARFDGKIVLVDGKTLFYRLKENNALQIPKNRLPLTPPAKNKPIKNFLDRKKSKTYLLFGLLFFLFGFISPFKTYYAVCGAFFLLVSLILRFFGKRHDRIN